MSECGDGGHGYKPTQLSTGVVCKHKQSDSFPSLKVWIKSYFYKYDEFYECGC